MKITHIVTSLKVGGAERFVIDLCEIQRKQHSDVSILSFGNASDLLIKVCESKKIPVKRINTNIVKRNFEILKQLMRTNVIHLHSPHALRAALLPLIILFNKKIIYTRHGERPFSEFRWKLLHKIAQLFIDHVTFVSEKGHDIFLNIQQLHRIPHHVIENGANTDNIEMIKNTESEKLRIGSVGRMVELKQQITLLKAMQYLDEQTRSKIEIHFFGNGECLNQLKEYTHCHEYDDRVIFHGMVTERNDIYNNIDVLVVTSETEGLSLAIIEAMAFIHPVLATSVGGNPKLVLSGITGYLFDYNDQKQLAYLIEKLVYDSVLLKELGENARKHIMNHYSLNNTAKKYFEIYS